VGESGCGKSTLFNVIAGLIEPYEGDVLSYGVTLSKKTGRVGYMPQRDLLLPWKRLISNITLGAELAGIEKGVAREQARGLLPMFGLAEFEKYYPYQMSGGMRQRAALLRTILTGHQVLLLDEPLGSLDALTRKRMQQWLLKIIKNHADRTILFVTHDVDEALYLADRVLVMSSRPGTIVYEADLRSIPQETAVIKRESLNAIKRQVMDKLGVNERDSYFRHHAHR
tara:strand:+ start:607 stop:1284 length:678 start_codon:yes stop_codon:yes gene_type:complete